MQHDVFKAALKQIGFTQGEFAVWAGYNRVTVNKWATGRDPVPLVIARLVSVMLSTRTRPDEVGT